MIIIKLTKLIGLFERDFSGRFHGPFRPSLGRATAAIWPTTQSLNFKPEPSPHSNQLNHIAITSCSGERAALEEPALCGPNSGLPRIRALICANQALLATFELLPVARWAGPGRTRMMAIRIVLRRFQRSSSPSSLKAAQKSLQ